MQINNPILRGFNPDPSIIRVGEDYYIAVSTFEWFPGVQIYHSKDLIDWKLVAQPLNRLSQLDMRGNPDSCGVWAPCLSYDNGTFYLVYSNVRSFDGAWKDTPNYLVTTKDILGDWSDPIFLNASGFDGSLFHDDDGRKWYLSMRVDHRKGKFFGGIILQEYSIENKCLFGEVYYIFPGSDLGLTEAPHLYKRNGYYYLVTAEGGTEYGHAVSLARSKTLTGTYELHPENPIISNRNYPKAALQKCGHGDLVETIDKDWYAVFLIGRPLEEHGHCILGRETAMARVEWRADDWLYLVDDLTSEVDTLPVKLQLHQDDFAGEKLNRHWQSLRVPMTNNWVSLKAKENTLRLYGRESLSSLHRQSLVARRLQHFQTEISVGVDFQPTSFQQMAGLVCYYNTAHWYYLHLMGDEDNRTKYLQLIRCDNYEMEEILTQPIKIVSLEKLFLKAVYEREKLQFYYAEVQNEWKRIGEIQNSRILSDDYVRDGSARYRPAFTGTFVGLCCQDLTGQGLAADFSEFEYKEV